jgi:hypothetical protein
MSEAAALAMLLEPVVLLLTRLLPPDVADALIGHGRVNHVLEIER